MIVSRNSRYGIVGAYVPPSDTTTLVHIATALARFPSWKVILVGDLNLDLDSIETDRDIEIADILANSGLLDMHHHFKARCGNQQHWTWHHKSKGGCNPVKARLFSLLGLTNYQAIRNP